MRLSVTTFFFFGKLHTYPMGFEHTTLNVQGKEGIGALSGVKGSTAKYETAFLGNL